MLSRKMAVWVITGLLQVTAAVAHADVSARTPEEVRSRIPAKLHTLFDRELPPSRFEPVVVDDKLVTVELPTSFDVEVAQKDQSQWSIALTHDDGPTIRCQIWYRRVFVATAIASLIKQTFDEEAGKPNTRIVRRPRRLNGQQYGSGERPILDFEQLAVYSRERAPIRVYARAAAGVANGATIACHTQTLGFRETFERIVARIIKTATVKNPFPGPGPYFTLNGLSVLDGWPVALYFQQRFVVASSDLVSSQNFTSAFLLHSPNEMGPIDDHWHWVEREDGTPDSGGVVAFKGGVATAYWALKYTYQPENGSWNVSGTIRGDTLVERIRPDPPVSLPLALHRAYRDLLDAPEGTQIELTSWSNGRNPIETTTVKATLIDSRNRRVRAETGGGHNSQVIYNFDENALITGAEVETAGAFDVRPDDPRENFVLYRRGLPEPTR